MSTYTDPLVRSPLACRLGWGVAEAWADRKQEILDGASGFADAKSDATGHGAVAIILASLFVGPNVLPVAAALSFDIGFVAGCAGRLREAEVWLRDSMFYPWLEKSDDEAYIGCILDSLIATGAMEKVGPDSYRLLAGAT